MKELTTMEVLELHDCIKQRSFLVSYLNEKSSMYHADLQAINDLDERIFQLKYLENGVYRTLKKTIWDRGILIKGKKKSKWFWNDIFKKCSGMEVYTMLIDANSIIVFRLDGSKLCEAQAK